MSISRTISDLNWWLLASSGRRAVDWATSGPTISFTFDDFPRSAYTVGGRILRSYNARATYYTAMALIDTVNELGVHFSRQDLESLTGDGHELANHTFGHLSSRRTPSAEYVHDVRRGSEALRQFAPASTSLNFSYPFGHVTRGVKADVGDIAPSCRSTRAGINGPDVDLNLLKANRLYSHSFDLEATRRLIEENDERGGWLIFYTHDIQDEPSPYGCTAGQFESIVKLAANSRARVSTVNAALASIQVTVTN